MLVEDINAMRAPQSLPELPETCFRRNAGHRYVSARSCTQPAQRAWTTGLPRRLRHLYQVGLLGGIRGHADPVHLRLMQRAAERMLGLTGGGAAGEYWWLLGGVLEVLPGARCCRGVRACGALSRADAMFRDYLRHPARRDELVSPQLREEMLGWWRVPERARAQATSAHAPAWERWHSVTRSSRRNARGCSACPPRAGCDGHRGRGRVPYHARGTRGTGRPGRGPCRALDGVRDALARVQERLQAGGLPGAALLLAREMETLGTRRADGAALGKDELLNLADAIVQTEASLGAFVRSQRGAGGGAQRGAAALAAPARRAISPTRRS
ncbi:MAG: hypothetical protein IPO20_10170 [Gammaproteobacteria bacterium]|nr:hypothetical protein [Gammaproteobacteria bacterium]